MPLSMTVRIASGSLASSISGLARHDAAPGTRARCLQVDLLHLEADDHIGPREERAQRAVRLVQYGAHGSHEPLPALLVDGQVGCRSRTVIEVTALELVGLV